jgi:hypothetical protein
MNGCLVGKVRRRERGLVEPWIFFWTAFYLHSWQFAFLAALHYTLHLAS